MTNNDPRADEAAMFQRIVDRCPHQLYQEDGPVIDSSSVPAAFSRGFYQAAHIAASLAAPADRAGLCVTDSMVSYCYDNIDPIGDQRISRVLVRRILDDANRYATVQDKVEPAPAGADTPGEPRRKVSAGRDMDDKPDGGY